MTTERTTMTLLQQLDECEGSRQAPILIGNTGDVFASPHGPIYDLPHLLAYRAADRGLATVRFSLARGSSDLNPAGRMPGSGLRHVTTEDGAGPALSDLLAQLEVTDAPVWLLIDYSDLLIPPSTGADSTFKDQEKVVELLAEQALRQSSGRTRHQLAVLARAGASVDPRLISLPSFRSITIGLPDLEERRTVLRRLKAPQVGNALELDHDLDLDSAAVLTGGLSSFDLLHARERSQTLGRPLTRVAIQETKAHTMQRMTGDSLQILDSGRGLQDVSGLPQLRKLIQEYLATGIFPRRVAVIGPPGCGKTLVVRAAGREMGVPVVRLANFRSMWVGESDRNLANVWSTVRALAPCIILMDELDQDLGQRMEGPSGDSGLSARLQANIWGELGDSGDRDGVIVMATSNRPDLLDPAMFDRFEFIPVLHPTSGEAAGIMRLAAEREGEDLDIAAAEEEIRRYGKLLTGRVLVSVTDRAVTLARVEGTRLAGRHLRDAFAELLTAAPAGEHERLALMAIAATTFASRLPWEAARSLGEPIDVPYYVRPFLDPVTGRLDSDRLAQRLAAR